MFNVVRKSIEWGGRTLTLETGRVARQADGAVMVTYGDTVVLCTAVGAAKPKPGQDFFPLTVNYQEKYSASGRIPGGFFKREGRPTERETLLSRLIDRPLRPLFAEGYLCETQVVCTVLSYDLENDPDMPAMVGASAALTLSGLPFMGPIGGASVGYRDGEYVLNPKVGNREGMLLDLSVAGTTEGVLMVESEASELSEEVMLGAVKFGHNACKEVIGLIIDLAEEAAKEPRDLPAPTFDADALKEKIVDLVGSDIQAGYSIKEKEARRDAIAAAKDKALEAFASDEDAEFDAAAVGKCFKSAEADVLRGAVLKTGKRIDGRDTKTVRPIVSEVSVLPRTHGSSLFTRGETQALVTCTLGTGRDEQMIDSLDGEFKSRFMLHYNFPPYSVGEAGRMGSPGRREIGHGKLAWRAINPLMPSQDDFPYVVRLISEITESNGSSSMATVCGSSLALMDAGAPLKRPVAGIAMGLIKEGDEFAVLSDILGDEDHLGDMDFKVAGSAEGITALQMDIKITSITPEIMEIALGQAKDGRIHILGEMEKALGTAREGTSAHAPQIVTIQINKDKIRDVIGSGGKVIREITETTGATIDIEEDGTINIAASDAAKISAAKTWIEDITGEAEEGKIYLGKVVNTKDFGAFVNFMKGKDGLVHISNMKNERVAKTTDVVSEGDEVYVLCLGIDDRGKVSLSMKDVDQETGDLISKED